MNCATLGITPGDDHWTRTGMHVEFKNTSAADQGLDFWNWDTRPTGEPFRFIDFRAIKKNGSLVTGFGIVWSYRDDSNFARLLINADRQISVHEIHDGKEVIIVDWQPLDQLNPGLGIVNEIRLEQLLQGIGLMVNGRPAGVINATYRLEGKMGCYCAVDVGEVNPGDVVIGFDFDAYQLENRKVRPTLGHDPVG